MNSPFTKQLTGWVINGLGWKDISEAAEWRGEKAIVSVRLYGWPEWSIWMTRVIHIDDGSHPMERRFFLPSTIDSSSFFYSSFLLLLLASFSFLISLFFYRFSFSIDIRPNSPFTLKRLNVSGIWRLWKENGLRLIKCNRDMPYQVSLKRKKQLSDFCLTAWFSKWTS